MSKQSNKSSKDGFPCHFTETVKQCGIVFDSKNVEKACFNNFMGENAQKKSDIKNS